MFKQFKLKGTPKLRHSLYKI